MNKDTKIIWKSIDELIPYEHNAKEHNKTQVNDGTGKENNTLSGREGR